MRSLRQAGSLIIAALIAGAWLRCSPTQTAGSVTEGGNVQTVSLRGSVADSLGNPVGGATVRLRPGDFLRDTSLASGLGRYLVSVKDTVTDGQGEFRIDSVDTGEYALEITGPDSQGVLVRWHATGDTDVEVVPPQTVLPLGSIAGVVVEGDSLDTLDNTYYVQVSGLDVATRTDTNGAFVIRGVPVGTYALRVSSSDPDDSVLVVDTVDVEAGETFDVDTIDLDTDGDLSP